LCEESVLTALDHSSALQEVFKEIDTRANVEITGYGKLYGKVAVIMKSGDVKPVAKMEFALLPFSLIELHWKLNQEASKLYSLSFDNTNDNTNPLFLPSYDTNWRFYLTLGKLRAINYASKKYASKNITILFETDFDGNYSLEKAPAGDWYVSGIVKVGLSTIMWSVPIHIEPNQSYKLDLYNGNAAKDLLGEYIY